jgi:transposase-like protein
MSQPTESHSSQRPTSFTEAFLGERTARQREKLQEIQLRHAANEEHHNKVRNALSTTIMVVFTLAVLFGMFMGCVAMWNAVVG